MAIKRIRVQSDVILYVFSCLEPNVVFEITPQELHSFFYECKRHFGELFKDFDFETLDGSPYCARLQNIFDRLILGWGHLYRYSSQNKNKFITRDLVMMLFPIEEFFDKNEERLIYEVGGVFIKRFLLGREKLRAGKK